MLYYSSIEFNTLLPSQISTVGNNCILDFSNNFVLNSDIISINNSKNLVLLFYYRLKKEYLLLKGWKNISKILEDVVIHKIIKKFGYKCYLLRHDLSIKV